MTHTYPRYTIFVLLRSLPAWLALPRERRNEIGASVMANALLGGGVEVRHYDTEAFTAYCTDVAQFEVSELGLFYRTMERLRDSVLLSTPYFEVIQILPSIQDGFRHVEIASAGAA